MPSYHSKKFWIIFWVASFFILSLWYLFWQLKNHRTETIDSTINVLPISEGSKSRYKALNHFADLVLEKDGKEKTFMIIFQNNMELRPGGGHIGSFGLLKIKNGSISQMKTYDLSTFDSSFVSNQEAPYPIGDILGTSSWKMRDSNYSPDFRTNAQKADEFYHVAQGEGKLDGIIAVNADVLESFLKVTGPIEVLGYPGTYNSGNAIISLEYQVEKGYLEQGIEKGERKSIMDSLSDEIIKKYYTFNLKQKAKLAEIIMEDLKNKDIQLYFRNPELENYAISADWAGLVKEDWQGDYLMMVDANLGSYKSDYYVKRSFEYTADFSKDIPTAHLKITYNHTAKIQDWMTRNYLSYLRVYVPGGSSLISSHNLEDIRFQEEFGKDYFGSIIRVPLGQTKEFQLSYTISQNLDDKEYNLLIQKQSGLEGVPGKVTIIEKDGSQKSYDISLAGDWKLK